MGENKFSDEKISSVNPPRDITHSFIYAVAGILILAAGFILLRNFMKKPEMTERERQVEQMRKDLASPPSVASTKQTEDIIKDLSIKEPLIELNHGEIEKLRENLSK